MKKFILAIALVFSLCMAEVYKPKLEVGREIEISYINKKRIHFIIRDNGKVLLSGEAYDKYGGDFGSESDEENGAGYDVIEYYHEGNCWLTLRIQDMPIDNDDTEQRISVKIDEKDKECINLNLHKYAKDKEKFYRYKKW